MRHTFHSNGRLWIATTIVLAAIATTVVALQPSHQRTPASTPPLVHITTKSGFQRGLYAGAVVDSSGRLKVAETLNRVVEANANTYYYILWDRLPKSSAAAQLPVPTVSADAWTKLPVFAAAAAKRKVNVVVYLVPPTESQPDTYRPFGWDYAAWFTAIGHVAAIHRNIVGIAIDDLGTNLPSPINQRMHPSLPKLSLPSLATYRADARRFAPWIQFFAILYASDLLKPSGQLMRIRTVADGIIYPFAGLESLNGGHLNTVDPSGLLATVAKIRALTSCGGPSMCWQAHFAGGGTASASTRILGWPARSSLQLRFAQDSAAYIVHATVDGRRISGVAAPRGRLSISLPPVGAGRHEIRLSFSAREAIANPELTVNSVLLVSPGRSTPLLHQPRTVTWELGTTGHVGSSTFTSVRSLTLVVMYFCARFGIEGDVTGAADSNYLRALVPQLVSVAERGLADGLVAFRLNLTRSRISIFEGDQANYPIVRDMYGAMSH